MKKQVASIGKIEYMNPLEKVPFATFYPLQNTCFFKNDFFKWIHT